MKKLLAILLSMLILSFALTVVPVLAAAKEVIAVNCGGTEIDEFLADQIKTNSNTWGYVYDEGFDANTPDPSYQIALSQGLSFESENDFGIPMVFTSELVRHAKNLEYVFDLPNKAYTVELYIAETWFQEPGQRNFDIVVEGKTVKSNFDAFKEAGLGGANQIVSNVDLKDGHLNISLVPLNNSSPNINAIVILEGGSAPQTTNPPATDKPATDKPATTEPAETDSSSSIPIGTSAPADTTAPASTTEPSETETPATSTEPAQSQTAAQPDTAQPSESGIESNTNNNAGNFPWAIVIIAVVVLAGGGAAAFFILKKKSIRSK